MKKIKIIITTDFDSVTQSIKKEISEFDLKNHLSENHYVKVSNNKYIQRFDGFRRTLIVY